MGLQEYLHTCPSPGRNTILNKDAGYKSAKGSNNGEMCTLHNSYIHDILSNMGMLPCLVIYQPFFSSIIALGVFSPLSSAIASHWKPSGFMKGGNLLQRQCLCSFQFQKWASCMAELPTRKLGNSPKCLRKSISCMGQTILTGPSPLQWSSMLTMSAYIRKGSDYKLQIQMTMSCIFSLFWICSEVKTKSNGLYYQVWNFWDRPMVNMEAMNPWVHSDPIPKVQGLKSQYSQ